MSANVVGPWVLALSAMFLTPAKADELSLRHDPFARPALGALSVGDAKSAVAEAPPPPWRPQLTAVMIAGKDSLATVDGAIVRLSEQISGHRLVQVRDRQAVFQTGSQRTVLEIQPTSPHRGKDQGGK